MVQKLFNVEKLHKRHFLHCSFGGNGAYAILQHRINFEPLIQFSKTKMFWNQLTLGQHFLILNYLIYVCNFNHLLPL